MPFTTERHSEKDGTTTIVMTPQQESHQSGLVVLAHGLGDSAEGLEDLGVALSQAMPYCKFILPTAPIQPVTLNGGMRMNSWYDIVGMDERSNESCHGIEDSRVKLAEFLRKEHEETKLPYGRMVLAGFSPVDQKLAGVCLLSGYLPHAKQFQITSGLESVPVFHGQ
jgi:predicted esterase